MAETKPTSCWIRSLDVETENPVEGNISGQIPDWLEGTLIRNGSGIFHVGDKLMNHLFDGFSVLHRFAIHEGKATYQNRILKSNTYVTSKETNRLTVWQFGTYEFPDPCKSLLGKFMSRFTGKDEKTDNCSVNVCYYGDSLYAMTETEHLRQIDPNSLETIGEKVTLSNYIAVNHATAHPHVDGDGTVYNMGNSVGDRGPIYNVIQFPPSDGQDKLTPFSKAKIVAKIPARWKFNPSYYHSFAMTENYFIFTEFPMTINVAKLKSMKLLRKPFSSVLTWSPKEKTRFAVVERSTGNLVDTCYLGPSFFCFHHGNAYEKDGHIIMDLCVSKEPVIDDLMIRNLKNPHTKPASTHLTRFVLPLNPKRPEKKNSTEENLNTLEGTTCKSYWLNNNVYCEPERLSELSIELPRINYKLNGKVYRYLYAAGFLPEDAFETLQVVKIDTQTKTEKIWKKDGLNVSEPVFVASPNAVDEDDGVVLFSALDRKDDKRVFLIILNAATFEEVASIEFSALGTVSKDFHGIFSQTGENIHRY